MESLSSVGSAINSYYNNATRALTQANTWVAEETNGYIDLSFLLDANPLSALACTPDPEEVFPKLANGTAAEQREALRDMEALTRHAIRTGDTDLQLRVINALINKLIPNTNEYMLFGILFLLGDLARSNNVPPEAKVEMIRPLCAMLNNEAIRWQLTSALEELAASNISSDQKVEMFRLLQLRVRATEGNTRRNLFSVMVKLAESDIPITVKEEMARLALTTPSNSNEEIPFRLLSVLAAAPISPSLKEQMIQPAIDSLNSEEALARRTQFRHHYNYHYPKLVITLLGNVASSNIDPNQRLGVINYLLERLASPTTTDNSKVNIIVALAQIAQSDLPLPIQTRLVETIRSLANNSQVTLRNQAIISLESLTNAPSLPSQLQARLVDPLIAATRTQIVNHQIRDHAWSGLTNLSDRDIPTHLKARMVPTLIFALQTYSDGRSPSHWTPCAAALRTLLHSDISSELKARINRALDDFPRQQALPPPPPEVALDDWVMP